MNNKMLCVIICMLLFTTIIPTVNSSNGRCECDQNNKTGINTEEDYSNKYPVMIEPPELIDPNDETPKPTIIDTPDEFSWLDYDGSNWVTPAKHQGQCGSCWAFALLGVLESVIEIREDCPMLEPDLSEQYILSCLPSSGSCRGGSAYRAAENIINTSSTGNYHNGIIPESCMLYKADDTIPCSDKCLDWEEMLIPLSDYGTYRVYGTNDDREVIKTQIMQTGPVASDLKATDLFKIWGGTIHDSDSYYHDYGPTVRTNHIAMILGWKDSPSIGNGGYWICKNSWGEEWGYNGFFNIEYGALNIDNRMIVWADYNPDDYNWPPLADPGGPYSSNVGEEITFDAGNSIGYEGNIISYEWDFGDETIGNGKTITHTYSQQEEYIVTLTVTDSKGSTASETTFARVQDSNNNQPNKPNIDGQTSITLGEEYTYEVFSVDPDGDNIYYYISWGDGIIDEYGPEVYSSGDIVYFSKTWDTKGEYTVEVKAMDIYGAESEIGTISVNTPKGKQYINTPFIRFLQNYPIFHLLLQRVLRQ